MSGNIPSMAPREKTNARLRNLLYMAGSWTLAGNLFYLVRLVGIGEISSVRLIRPINFAMAAFEATAAGILLGLMFGVLDIFLEGSTLRRKPFGLIILIRSLAFVVTLFTTVGVVYILSQSVFRDFTPGEAFRNLGSFYTRWSFMVIMIYGSVITVLINFTKQVSRKFGPGNLRKLLQGSYHMPQEEERIFMFLDLKSSTTYAETLGHLRYSQLIQDCFYDLTDVVLRNKAEIYQYVGDEAILTWTVADGLEKARCIRAFFDYDRTLQGRSAYYEARYGLVPEFKAGVNMGPVIVAEVGEIKREIAYHGDVLNTAARIQGKCNDFNRKLLISDHVEKKLVQRGGTVSERMGSVPLKGKLVPLDIYSVVLPGSASGS